jgi:hypothetical protein
MLFEWQQLLLKMVFDQTEMLLKLKVRKEMLEKMEED